MPGDCLETSPVQHGAEEKKLRIQGEKLVMLLANVHRRQALGDCGVLRQRTRKKMNAWSKNW